MSRACRMRPLAARFAIALAGCALAAAPAAAQPVETVIQDDALLLHGSDEAVRTAMGQIRELGFDRVRLTAEWSRIAPERDADVRPLFDARDPEAYPPGVWNHLDRAVKEAVAAGLRPMIDIGFWAPRWATSEPEVTDRPRREVKAADFGEFATAVARRYSGSHSPPPPPAPPPPPEEEPSLLDEILRPQPSAVAEKLVSEAVAPLPAVDLFTIWNEPNHAGFLMPQWEQVDGRWIARSADLYRDLVYAGYDAVKAAHPKARVLVGATASMGSSVPGEGAVPPLQFLRRLACVDEDLRPETSGACADFRPIPGDGWSHHPYSLRTTPDVDTINPDKLPVAATPRLTGTLAQLAAAGRMAPDTADVYMTEYGYETRPHDPRAPFTDAEQPALLAWAEAIATSDPAVRMWPQFQLHDRPEETSSPARRWSDWQSGLFDSTGRPKPAAAQWRQPVHAACLGAAKQRRGKRRRVEVWARLRGAGAGATARVQRRLKGRWRTVPTTSTPRQRRGAARVAARAEVDTVRRFVTRHRGTQYRVRWRAGDGGVVTAPAVPQRCS